MDFVLNFPLFGIVGALFSGVLCSVLKRRGAEIIATVLLALEVAASVLVLIYTMSTGQSYTYMMGHFPAPWGNEIRIGILESLTALFFTLIMLMSLVGGRRHIVHEVEESKVNLYYTMACLLLSSILALIYTNDLFTAYVFVEINTLSAAGLIMIKSSGKSIAAATKYMVMSLLGSGLFLLGICMTYDITGHLLMKNIKESMRVLHFSGEYAVPITVIIGLMSVGLAIKSALYPFHTWLPDAHGSATVSTSAILSALVSEVYMFLLIKIIYRVIGWDVIQDNKILNVLYIFGILAMLMGSIHALRESDIKQMIAYSSIAQFGYIFMGIGLGTAFGMQAAVFHLFAHASGKALVFVAQAGLADSNGGDRRIIALKGTAHRNLVAGLTFTVGAFSMVGIPFFAGFISKYNFATAALYSPHKIILTLVVLAISTILNAIYFLRVVIRIFSPIKDRKPVIRSGFAFSFAVCIMAATNVLLGIYGSNIMEIVKTGLSMFS